MRMLLTGASGMLGRDLAPVFAGRHELEETDLAELDVTDFAATRRIVLDLRPDCVVHMAAMTHVDRCETEPENAYQANTLGTRNVAIACREAGCEMVYISTLAVFDGEKDAPYHEFDAPSPQSVYGRSKYLGEQYVTSLLSRYYVVRPGWLFGGGPEDKKFVAKILDLAREKDELTVVDDKFGSPTYAGDLAGFLLRLIESGQHGIYHAVNRGTPVSRYELAREILSVAGIKGCRVVPVDSSAFPLPAPRPRMEAATNLAAQLCGIEELPPWRESLARYVRERLLAEDVQR